MKKKIGLGITAILIIVGAVVYAQSSTTKNDSNCPDRPGCICKATTEEVATAQATTMKEENCTERPGCICK